jgi:pilus assembly protein CpaB
MAGRTITRPRADRSQRYVFFLGILLAAVAAIIVFVAVSAADGGSGGGDIAVVVAKEAIPAQTAITSDMLEVEFMSPDDAIGDAFTRRSQVVDRVATQNIEKDDQVLPSMVSDVAGDSLPFKVDPGMRALSVSVKEVVTVGGNIQPGDRVDVVGIFEVEDVEAANHLLSQLGVDATVEAPPLPKDVGTEGGFGSGNLFLTATMLQNVKLLALAQEVTDTSAGGDNLADQVDESNAGDADPGASSATLELTPKQAQDVAWADEFGILRMEARPVGDSTTQAIAPTLIRAQPTR